MLKKNKQTNWVERNTNLVASILTFITILITIYFSNKSFNLANKQYNDLLIQRSQDSVKNSIQQAKNEYIHLLDSLNIVKQESEQRTRWLEQFNINKQQLITFKNQAEIAKLQFENQKKIYLAQREADRPNLLFAAVNIDTFANSKSLSRLFFANSGKLTTTVKRIIVFAWNIVSSQWTSGDFPDDIEVNSVNSVFVDLPLPSSFVVNSNTVYFVRLFYIDNDKKISHKDIFSSVDMAYLPKISLKTIPDYLQINFRKFLDSKVKNLDEVLKEPNSSVPLQFR